MYSAVNQKECATAKAAVLVNKAWRRRTRSCNWVTEVIINIRLRASKGYFTITGNYAPGEAKIENREVFYKELEVHLSSNNRTDCITWTGNFNGRVENHPIERKIRKNWREPTLNQAGKSLLDLISFNGIKFTNNSSIISSRKTNASSEVKQTSRPSRRSRLQMTNWNAAPEQDKRYSNIHEYIKSKKGTRSRRSWLFNSEK